MQAGMLRRGGRGTGGWRQGAVTRTPRRLPVREERGMVTAELALAIPALVLVVTALAWLLGLAATQVMLGQAAREGARAAARGEDGATITRAVHQVVADAQVGVRPSGDLVIVALRVRRDPGPAVLRWLGRDLRASATAWREQP